jgi:S1-C subfamily serine protease
MILTLAALLAVSAPVRAQEFAPDLDAARALVQEARGARPYWMSHKHGILQQIDAAFAHLTSESKPSVAMVRTAKGLGTGFVADAKGLVVTNAHVVIESGLNAKVAVVFADGTAATGTVSAIGTMGTNQEPFSGRDLAIVTLPARPQGWPALELGNARDLREGELVFMMGYPLGLPFTVTQGVIGGLDRRDGGVPGFPVRFVQSDAAINPGNSGGPLLTADGRVIGVNTLTLSQSGASSGLGFSVGVEAVKAFLAEYKARGAFQDGARRAPPSAARALTSACPADDGLTRPWIEHRGPAPAERTAAHLASGLDAAEPLLVPIAGTSWWVGASRRGRGAEGGINDPSCFARGTAALYANGPEDAPAADFVSVVSGGGEASLGGRLVELRWFDPKDGRKHRWFDAARARALGWPSADESPLPLPEAVNELL